MDINLRVNGAQQSADVEPRTLLCHLLRDELDLTGTHVGCETSLCGACTGLVAGKAIKSCTRLAVQCDGQEVTTIEGLEKDGELHALQTAFREKHGLQCGYCTTGMIMTAVEVIERGWAKDDPGVRHALEGNLCRCTGYQNIVDAVLTAAERVSS